MSVMSKVQVFVPAPKVGEATGSGFSFPRLRLVALLRRVVTDREPGLGGVIKLVDNRWPAFAEDAENPDRERFLRRYDGCGVGIMVTFIGDDAMLGRIMRARYEYKNMAYIINSIEEIDPLNHEAVFVCNGGE